VSPRTSCAIKQAISAADRRSLSSQLKESFKPELFASPANQTGETTYDTAAEYISSTESAVNFTILGSWWMTREIELAAAKISDAEQTSRDTTRWKLPAPKNTPQGKKYGDPTAAAVQQTSREPTTPPSVATRFARST
jgi:hypothetical protein